jgi:carbon-monoxide dehydrogenase medium subunit
VKAAAFDYHAPATAREAVSLLAELGDGAKVIAGGQSLVPMLALRLAVFDDLVDIRRIAELRGIEERSGTGAGSVGGGTRAGSADGGTQAGSAGGAVWAGAGTTQAVIGRDRLIARAVPLLARATPLIGHFQIRNRGTIGGSLAHADAAAEYPAVALALDATIETLSPRGPRSIPAAEFFTGIWTTALEPDELLTGVLFPARAPHSGHAIEEFAVRSGDFAIAGAAVSVELDDQATGIRRAGIGLFGLGSTPLRSPAAEAALTGRSPADLDADEIGHAAMAGLDAIPSDLHGSAAYRAKVGAAVVATAIRRALRKAQDYIGGGDD